MRRSNKYTSNVLALILVYIGLLTTSELKQYSITTTCTVPTQTLNGKPMHLINDTTVSDVTNYRSATRITIATTTGQRSRFHADSVRLQQISSGTEQRCLAKREEKLG